ncbi:MAG: ABC transporter permease [Jiangellaceae bacterium]
MLLLRAAHTTSVTDDCLVRNEWVCPEYLSSRYPQLLEALGEHVYITVASLVGGTLVALALALVARRHARLRALVQGVSTGLYTIPSLALFSLLLVPGFVLWGGLSSTTVIIGLILYSLTILVRGILAGLDGVERDAKESAIGMGYGSRRLLWQVELPLALPAIFAALRVASVSTVALTTVGVIVGHGGLGNLIFEGFQSNFRSQVLTASVLCVVLAVVADLLLVGTERLTTPWRRTAV